MKLNQFLPATALLLPTVASASVWDRSVHMVYALLDNLGIPSITDQQYLDAFALGEVTALVPFFLNVANPSKYASMISKVQAMNITIVPGIGKSPGAGDIDGSEYQAMAKAVKPYTDYVRIENMQGFYNTYGSTGTQNFINYLTSLGFKSIMMNPWPEAPGGGLVPYKCSICNVAFNAVACHRKSTDVLEPNPNNWHVQVGPIKQLDAVMPNFPVLINYESPGPQTILSNMEMKTKGSSLTAFETTVGDITGPDASYNLYWAPPLTQSYNSIGLGTWSWIASELKNISKS